MLRDFFCGSLPHHRHAAVQEPVFVLALRRACACQGFHLSPGTCAPIRRALQTAGSLTHEKHVVAGIVHQDDAVTVPGAVALADACATLCAVGEAVRRGREPLHLVDVVEARHTGQDPACETSQP